MNDRKKAIGIFDSGIGGLTVVKEISRLLPQERIVYFGDTARVPYGSKSKETVTKFSFQNTRFLLEQKVKMVIVACNTASALSLQALREEFKDLPILGVIEPGAKAAVSRTKKKRIGVIGTLGTIASGVYEKNIRELIPEVLVIGQACPLFVPLVEEGWINKQATRLITEEYLTPLRQAGIDTLVLGCTHYPLLKGVIQNVIGEEVSLVDSAFETALAIKEMLTNRSLLRESTDEPEHTFFVSDLPLKFLEMGERFLGRVLPNCLKVTVEGL
ncbi:MAG: glutamate racemase [Candidatus Edwardsbacteria bacterium]